MVCRELSFDFEKYQIWFEKKISTFFLEKSQVTKDILLQWGELSTSVAYISNGKVMGWGNKAIEIRNVDSATLDRVFMHKRAQKLKYLCEKNEKVFFSSIRNGSSCQIYFMALNKMSSW
ncbi:hypothetical protein I4U23_021780 [Adineta vaga]|nr:hypothetical protein I4U23_021780 [Adineta vaga]